MHPFLAWLILTVLIFQTHLCQMYPWVDMKDEHEGLAWFLDWSLHFALQHYKLRVKLYYQRRQQWCSELNSHKSKVVYRHFCGHSWIYTVRLFRSTMAWGKQQMSCNWCSLDLGTDLAARCNKWSVYWILLAIFRFEEISFTALYSWDVEFAGSLELFDCGGETHVCTVVTQVHRRHLECSIRVLSDILTVRILETLFWTIITVSFVHWYKVECLEDVCED